MHQHSHLFLFGSGPPFTDQLAKSFSQCLVTDQLTILYVEREGSTDYIPIYKEKIDMGSLSVKYLPVKTSYTEEELTTVRNSGGLIIGGGDTEKYRKCLVETPLASIISNLFSKGVPVAGFSAGALIAPETCVISHLDNIDGVQKFEKGLGLLPDTVLAAHFLEWEEEENLKRALEVTGAATGYGIAEKSGIYLCDGVLKHIEGYAFIENKR